MKMNLFCQFQRLSTLNPSSLKNHNSLSCRFLNGILYSRSMVSRNFVCRVYSSSTGNPTRSTFSIKLVTAMCMGVCGSMLLYQWRKRNEIVLRANCREDVQVSNRFKGKVALITGAAGDIGGHTAKRFAREGATVIMSDLPLMENVLQSHCVELKKLGATDAFVVTADITQEEEVVKMVNTAKEKAGHIDMFFNNAGIQGELRPIHEQRDKEFKKVLNVNVYGIFICLKYVSQVMIKQGGGGVIVNTASLAGVLGPANMAAYAASKFAVVGMTKTASKDLARHGIRVCAIAPGILEGRMWDTQVRGNAKCRKRVQGDSSEVTPEEIREQEERMINGTPLQRLGKLSEVASVVAFLCSEEASYLSGVTLPIDGGRIQ